MGSPPVKTSPVESLSVLVAFPVVHQLFERHQPVALTLLPHPGGAVAPLLRQPRKLRPDRVQGNVESGFLEVLRFGRTETVGPKAPFAVMAQTPGKCFLGEGLLDQ